MVDFKVKISKPLAELPPSEIKTYKVTASRVFDFARIDQKICVEYIIHNHTGGTFTYRINDQDPIDLKSLEERVANTQIYKIELISPTDADLIVKLISINELKARGALSNA